MMGYENKIRTSTLLLLAAALSAGPAAAGAAIYMPPEDLAARAAFVVEGPVVRTASGLDPADGSLSTYVTLRVDTVHRGALAPGEVVLREPGGRYGELVHQLDSVPIYTVGERVLAFLETAPDGALRTCGMFFGKFTLRDGDPRGIRIAERDLEGLGRIPSRIAARTERIPASDLEAIVASVPRHHRRTRPAPARARPEEYDRLLWDEVREPGDGPKATGAASDPSPVHLDEIAPPRAPGTDFVAMSSTDPTRWFQADQNAAVSIEIQRSGDPLGDGAAAVAEMARAMAAWTEVPESRLALEIGNDDYDWTGTHSESPAARYYGTNVILFGDPYDDISDPSGCSGVLAIGGYWRSSSIGGTVNNVDFHPALQLYVIFNNDFECFLGTADNLAEVATHELGHGIGFGHSVAPDSIMRSSAYGYRGPRLGEDDRDAVHCHYPHRISLQSPDGGEVLEAGAVWPITWDVSEERGPNNGEVDLEYSVNGGVDWIEIARGTTNDGYHAWLVPSQPAADVRVRVSRPHRDAYAPAIYPDACSFDGSDSSFSIVAPPPLAGSIPPGPGDAGLTVQTDAGGLLRLRWSASCSGDVEDHAVYRGSLDALRAGSWDHAPVTCSAGVDLVEYVDPGPGDVYFLVAPLAGGAEGEMGRDSGGQPRPSSASACAPREADSTCD